MGNLNPTYDRLIHELKSKVLGIASQNPYVPGKHLAYQQMVLDDMRRVVSEYLQKKADDFGLKLNLSELEVKSGDVNNNQMNLTISASHKLFVNPTEENLHLREAFSMEVHEETGMYIPPELVKMQRIILELEIEP